MTLPFNLYTHIATIISYVLSATTNLEVGPDRIYLILERSLAHIVRWEVWSNT